MVEKFFPLPDGWREMYDAGTGRHYYWCTKTDKVSWLPPGHPRSKATEAASKIRELLASEASLRKRHKEDEEDKMSLDSDMDNSEDEEDRRLEEQRKKEKAKRKEVEKKDKGEAEAEGEGSGVGGVGSDGSGCLQRHCPWIMDGRATGPGYGQIWG